MTPARRPANHDLVRLFREYERFLVGVSLVSLTLLGAFAATGVMLDRIRVPVLYRVEKILNYWDDRWSRRLEYGERLVKTKDYPQAVEYLEALDREFPAQYVKHKRDQERERLLQALGHSYSEMGKKRLTLDTYRRLVEFDPRNFENHYSLAEAALKFKETKIAEEQLTEVLKIHPTHVPSLRATLKMHFDKGDFEGVVAAYETYLNAFLIQQVTVTLGQTSARVNVPVDGKLHDFEVRLNHLPMATGELVLQVGEFAIELKQITLQPPVLVGAPNVATTPLEPAQTPWRPQEMAVIKPGSYRALGPGAALHLDVSPQPRGVARVYFRMRLFKPTDSDLWSMVETSYRRLLRYDDLKATLSRSVVGNASGLD